MRLWAQKTTRMLEMGRGGVVFSRFFMTVKLEDQLRGAIRLKHFSGKTEETYVGWYRRYDGALPRHPSG